MITDINKHLLLTQASILEYLHAKSEWKGALDKPISEWLSSNQLNFPNGLVEISSDATVEEGFDKLSQCGLPALPVVASRKIKKVLSNSDVILLKKGAAESHLKMNILEFLPVNCFLHRSKRY